jgi:hypothetical protein
MFNAFLRNAEIHEDEISTDQLWQQPLLVENAKSSGIGYDRTNVLHMQSWLYTQLEKELTHMSGFEYCQNCKRSYTEKENIGRFECRYHPGAYVGLTYSCCYGSIPCQPCDHRTKRGDWPHSELTLAVPLHLLSLLKTHKDAILEPVYANEHDPARSYVFVRRANVENLIVTPL